MKQRGGPFDRLLGYRLSKACSTCGATRRSWPSGSPGRRLGWTSAHDRL